MIISKVLERHLINRIIMAYDQASSEFWISCAFWVYQLLVMRGVFDTFDPILTANEGDVLHIKEGCLHYYLFCDVQPTYLIDTVSVDIIGSWNKLLGPS